MSENQSLALYHNFEKLSKEDIQAIIKDKNLIDIIEQIEKMAQKNNPQYEARNLLDKLGLDDIIDIPISDFVSGIDLIYMEEPLGNCDGKIIFGNKKRL